MLVKKYSNRRLYDTEESRYITLDELAEKIRAGADARIVDASSGADLTQTTLTQIILEGDAGHLLPVPLLLQLIRLGDDALAEFFGRYVGFALEMYLAAKYAWAWAAATRGCDRSPARRQRLPPHASPSRRARTSRSCAASSRSSSAT
jgi:polyhydroxyalkanoate synthesis repressor PhaR